ncbi:hypothetical protein [Neisseria weaveri]|uniref:Uncharacterized protein n=1 Tax=Neisseria weaveri TaxID=28091 RepID=A0A448VNV6_9NEIS|nr:hypothetical protein [Neisseria weaveri]EGV36895.1 hypothetical protein l13_05980 [Neisseria weaveri ATCC 51223]EGV38973.1 hypothetical protein l11_00520 [Neisseria weaveri LMG 5135]SAY52021.1 Uncharacterised protein [Neisseria weaveri]VEJ51441.1 Uncharacterised protein [Neisseria weaveri]
MKSKGLLFILLLGFSVFSWAQRMVPADMSVGKLKSVQGSQLVLGNNTLGFTEVITLGLVNNDALLEMSPALRVRDERNRFIVSGKLGANIGKHIAVRVRNNQVDEIWILTEAEYAKFMQHKK